MATNIESIDTNLLLRVIFDDVAGAKDKVKKLLSDSAKQFLVEDVAISETAYIIEKAKKLPRQTVAKAIFSVMRQPNIQCNRQLFNLVLPFYIEHPSLSFNDCYLAFAAQLKQAEPLWTFDHKLAVQSGTAKELR
jgi:predicted nucleic acid-binding protein